jgi:hypothetical protein
MYPCTGIFTTNTFLKWSRTRSQTEMAACWVFAPCSLVDVYRRFRSAFRLCHQSKPRAATWNAMPGFRANEFHTSLLPATLLIVQHTEAAPVRRSVAVRSHDHRKMAFMLQLQIKQPRMVNVIELKIIWKTIGCFPSHDSACRHVTGTVWWLST